MKKKNLKNLKLGKIGRRRDYAADDRSAAGSVLWPAESLLAADLTSDDGGDWAPCDLSAAAAARRRRLLRRRRMHTHRPTIRATAIVRPEAMAQYGVFRCSHSAMHSLNTASACSGARAHASLFGSSRSSASPSPSTGSGHWTGWPRPYRATLCVSVHWTTRRHRQWAPCWPGRNSLLAPVMLSRAKRHVTANWAGSRSSMS